VSALDWLSAACIGMGALFALSGAVGLLRFRDFFARTHAAGVTEAAGAGLILLGLLLQADWDSGVRLVLILVLMLFTSPTAVHALAQSALRDGVEPLLGKPERRDE
jgi:multicomponent Na+:H+ antiporter subunit G